MGGGILKHGGSEGEQRKSRKLKWDEEALQEAQAELDALERCNPVDEPKTPFVHGVRAPSKSPVRSSSSEEETAPKRKASASSWSTTSEEEEDEENGDLTESSFEEHRKDHYQMRDALSKGKHLIETDDEEENE